MSELKSAPHRREFPLKDLQTKPLKVADVVKGLGLDVTKVSYIDEPPGILCGLRWNRTTLPGTDVQVEVRIQFAARGPFSDERKWDIKEVLGATVSKVTILPLRPLD
jgi:hypothetical protein